MIKYIKINEVADLCDFVKEASQVAGDIIVTRGRFSVDGKSLNGMLSLDLSEGVKIEFPMIAGKPL